MSRHIEFQIPGDRLWEKDQLILVGFLRTIRDLLGQRWGESHPVGLGLYCITRSTVTNKRLNLLKKRVVRALVTSRILCADAVRNDVYNLEQRIVHDKQIHPFVKVAMKED